MIKQRTCCVCRKKEFQNNMLKITKIANGEIYVNEKCKIFGRSTYICSNECMKKAIEKKLLNKAFRCNVSTNVYEKLTSLNINDIL